MKITKIKEHIGAEATGIDLREPIWIQKESKEMEIAPDKYLYFTQPG